MSYLADKEEDRRLTERIIRNSIAMVIERDGHYPPEQEAHDKYHGTGPYAVLGDAAPVYDELVMHEGVEMTLRESIIQSEEAAFEAKGGKSLNTMIMEMDAANNFED